MNNDSLNVIITGGKPLTQRQYGVMRIAGFRQLSRLVRIFCRTQQGAFAIIFAFLFPIMLGLLAWGIEGPRYLYQKARLSDTLEQAAVALTVADNSSARGNNVKNRELVSEYILAYLPGSNIHKKSLDIIRQVVASGVQYHVEARTWQFSWLSSVSFPGFSRVVFAGNNAAAEKNASIPAKQAPDTDVMFVVDFSGSMTWAFSEFSTLYPYGTGPELMRPEHKKITQLKEIMSALAVNFFAANKKNRLGVVPFQDVAPMFNEINLLSMGVYANPGADLHALSRQLKAENPSITSDEIADVVYERTDYHNTVDKLFISPDSDSRFTQVSHEHFFTIPLTSQQAEFNRFSDLMPGGSTFVTAGILEGVRELYRMSIPGRARKLIILSDGEDNRKSVINKLINMGMCEKIKASGIEMIFIGIDYDVKTDWAGSCVGKKNYYDTKTVDQLKRALTASVLPRQSSEETGRNIPAR